jgi:hypothetical protein
MTETGTTFSAFLDDALAQEFRRRESLDTRAMATVATSGTLVAFGGGVLAVGKVSAGHPLHEGWLIAAALAYLLAAGLAVAASLPRPIAVADLTTLCRMADRLTVDDEDTARRVCAQQRLHGIQAVRAGNARKAATLFAAQGCQVIGILVFLVAVWRLHA